MTGAEFKELRIKKGYRFRSELASALGCSVDAIRKWETGKRRVNPMAISFLSRRR